MNENRTYDWAGEPIEKTISKQHRESQACARRLRQMQSKRDKDAKRRAAAAPAQETSDHEGGT